MSCPDENQLVEFARGLLGEGAVAAVDAHLDGCAGCAELLATFARSAEGAEGAEGSEGSCASDHGELEAMTVASAIDGRYVFLEIIGAGSMGVVYAAYDRQLDRKVAIKVLRAPAGDSAAASERLKREAQAMARLSHPNVLPVHDVGTIADRIFIVMEFVDGETIAEWQEPPRPWREVLEVFRQAGRGLAASHDAGFVHRDFKPGNVLVGDDGRVRIADFGLASRGIAEASDREPVTDSDDLAITRTGDLVGTPAYMAPELFEGAAADARSDQFSFCVALYQSLHGRRPFPATTLTELVASLTAGQPLPPANGEVPTWLHRAVVRGLETDPARRHPSMSALLDTLDTLDTREETPRRRTRGSLFAVAVVVVAGAALILWRLGGHPAERCQGRTNALAGVWDDGVKQAMSAAFAGDPRDHAKGLLPIVGEGLDRYASAWIAMGIDSCKETFERGAQSERLLDLRARCLDRRLSELQATTDLLTRLPDPEVVDNAVNLVTELTPLASCADGEALAAAVPPPDDPAQRQTIDALGARLDQATALGRAGQYSEGLERARELAASIADVDHPPLEAEVLFALATLESSTGRATEAEATMRRAVKTAARARDDSLVARCWTRLAWLVGVEQAQRDSGLELVSVAETAVSRAGSTSADRAELMNVHGSILEAAGELGEARAVLERVVALETEIESPHLSDALNNLGVVMHKQGAFAEARARIERALALAEASLGPEHPEIAKYLNNLGSVLTSEGKLAEARVHLERALALREAGLRPNHGKTAESLTSLGTLLAELGDNDRARVLLERAVTAAEVSRGKKHPDVARVLTHLGNLYYETGKLDEAHDAHTRSLEIYETALGKEHLNVSYPLNTLGVIAQDQGKLDDARAYYLRSLAIREKTLGPDHPHTASPVSNLGDLLLAQGEPASALEYFERALAISEKSLGPDHPRLAFALIGVGQCQLRLRRTAVAVRALERALAVREAGGVKPLYLAEAQFPLAQALWQSGKQQSRAIPLARSARGVLDPSADAELIAEIDAWLRGRRAAPSD